MKAAAIADTCRIIKDFSTQGVADETKPTAASPEFSWARRKIDVSAAEPPAT
jgi:hypothetical protein